MRRRWIVATGALSALVVAGAVVAATSRTSPNPARDAVTGAAAGVVSSSPPVAASSGVASPAAQSSKAEVAPAPAPGQPLPTGSQTVAPTGPKIVRNATLSVQLGKGRFTAAFDRVASIAAANGGYVTDSSTATTSDKSKARSGTLTVRVPADRFDAMRQALGQLGTVEQETLRGEDVSGQLVDYDARIRSLSAQEDALNGLLAKATSVGDVLQVQNSLFSVRQQIEQLQAQRTDLDQQASLATIQVTLYEPGAELVPTPEPKPATGLGHSLVRARDGAVAVLGGMVVVLGWLAPLAALGLLGWAGLRLRRRVGRKAGGAPAAPAVS
jgi:hypothetical protein